MNLKEFIPTTEVSEVVHIMMLTAMGMYDKNPIVASIGYLSIACSIPLKLILNHFLAIKQEDNTLVREKIRAAIKAREIKAGLAREARVKL
ncbi:hypothetical protein BCT30_13645 [Enterovibrio norvegicus]|uniref:hypothetical protein n=1 Tax=Enterovibrio norvegicus TaxID=188144 RepID=UPI000C81E899|nr:hypothetical protein [Enterovibrio norvegicus]PMN52170.1 hypothetical protein BCT30_13645 [Enterovibrio norvegicus]